MGRPIQKKWFGEPTDPPAQIIVTGAKFSDGTTAIDAYILKQTGATAYKIQDTAKTHQPEILFMVNADSVNALMPGQCYIIATPFGGTALPCESIEQYRVKVYNVPNSTPRKTGDPAVSSVSSYEWVAGPATKPGQATLVTGEAPPVGQPAILTFNILGREAGDVSLNFAGVGMDIHIDWGDGDAPARFATWPQVHTYAEAGTYEVQVSGNAVLWTATDVTDKMVAVSTFGELPLVSLNGAYAGQTSLTTVPSILPPSVLNISNMFSGCTSFNEDLSGWDVTNVTEMEGTFEGAILYNQDLSGWNVSNVTNFARMFKGAIAFAQDVEPWDTSNATGMAEMFNGAAAYGADQDLTGWNVTLVPPSHLGPDFALGSLLPLDKYPGYVAPPATGGVTAITIVDAGFGYPTAPALTITGDGTGATGTIATGTGGFLHTPVVTAPGTGYTTATISIAPPVVTVQAILGTPVIVGGAITEVSVINGGTNYFAPGPVVFSGDGSNPGANYKVASGVITSVTVYAGGAGYTTATATVPMPAVERQGTATATITPDTP
jgi:surface protein